LSLVVLAKDNLVWKFFLGACVLTAALLQPHAPARSIAGGMGLAALVLVAWALVSRGRARDEKMNESTRNRNGRDR
jgi:hypothetical protein